MSSAVLIIDDDKHFRLELRDILKDEYDVVEAHDGEQAIEIIKRPNIIDLVILDIKMPGMQGIEVLRQLKQLEPDLIVIIITGYGTKDTILESLRTHADDFLEKPLHIEMALKRIKQLLDKKQNNVKGSVEKLKYFIDKNFHKAVSLKEASNIACLSPKYISKIFKEETGFGFNEYKIKLKIEKAKELLKTNDYNINEIAGKIGYMNVESFIRIFKNLTGVTPSEYKHKIRNG